MPITRRALLGAGAAGAGAALLDPLSRPSYAATDAPILKPTPDRWFYLYGTNAEMRWDSVHPHQHLTPPPRLFVRNHTRTPRLEARTYRLAVFGDGLREPRGRDGAASLSLADLRRLPSTRLTTVHECTGNGRSFFGTQQGTPAAGTQWKLGAVGGCSGRASGSPTCWRTWGSLPARST